MLFYSFEFLFLFLPVVLTLYYLINSSLGANATIVFLVVASFTFYGNWNITYVPLLAISITSNYLIGRAISAKKSRALLLLGIFINLSFLGYFKYTNFFLDNIDYLLETSYQVEDILLPLAISFYTFQQIAWLADSYFQKPSIGSGGFWRYALFVSFFPQLIAGPIVHHSEMMPQFERKSTFRINWVSISVGLTIFIIGLFKKVVIADSVGALATPVFDASLEQTVSFVDAWMASACYVLQVYFDFSGYSDMAIGLARMFNIRLPVNFDSPLKSRSIAEFWRKWHITMVRFFTSYVYTPMSIVFLRRQMKYRIGGYWAIYLTTIITFIVIGFWHGANWTYILFGGMHGILVIGNHAWGAFISKSKTSLIPKGLAVFMTVFAFGLTCVMYRAETVDSAINMYSSMLQTSSFDLSALSIPGVGWVVFGYLVAISLPNTQELMRRYRPAINLDGNWSRRSMGALHSALTWRPQARWAALMLIYFVISIYYLLDAERVQEFIYFQF